MGKNNIQLSTSFTPADLLTLSVHSLNSFVGRLGSRWEFFWEALGSFGTLLVGVGEVVQTTVGVCWDRFGTCLGHVWGQCQNTLETIFWMF